ncbi:MAG: BrnT family toxin [Hyphomonadaceae bacterium]|nr:BrnT family toxin [Hyphomonadaceae bacterium]
MPNPPPGFEWDEAKARWNLRVHGVSFAAVDDFDFATALELEGSDHETEEERILGKIKRKIYVFVFTRRAGKLRVISLRNATAQERRFYIEAKGY